ncbi:ROK family transcriptional regulator [Tsukamurella paurometabola]|nr:ROK family transcriptional regulator [Tsukamurella paurometabola]
MPRSGAGSPWSSSGSTAALRVANEQRIVGVLRADPASRHTQAELARATGLAPATVSNIVRDLVTAGLVEAEAGSGRRGGRVRLSRSVGLVAGVDFGHSHLAVAVGDVTGAILIEERRPLPPEHAHDTSLLLARDVLRASLARMRADPENDGVPLLRIGMAVPAPVSEGVIHDPGILPGWHDVDAVAAAEAAFDLRVDVENDATLGALAEHRRGIAQGRRSSVFVKASSGVGAGIVLDDRIYRGTNGTAGEVGHLTLDEHGPPCRCGGRGCLEAYASTAAVVAMLAGRHPGIDFDGALELARGGDAAARRAVEDAGLHLGWGLAGVANLLDPDLIVLGGDMARAGDLLLESTRMGLRRNALSAVARTPVAVSALGERASLVGAVLLAAERIDLTLA